jgi:hypothetical protein
LGFLSEKVHLLEAQLVAYTCKGLQSQPILEHTEEEEEEEEVAVRKRRAVLSLLLLPLLH